MPLLERKIGGVEIHIQQYALHLYLVVAREAIHESHSLKPAGVVNHYLRYGERESLGQALFKSL